MDHVDLFLSFTGNFLLATMPQYLGAGPIAFFRLLALFEGEEAAFRERSLALYALDLVR